MTLTRPSATLSRSGRGEERSSYPALATGEGKKEAATPLSQRERERK